MKFRHFSPIAFAFSLLLILALVPKEIEQSQLIGFTPQHSKQEYQLEEKFDSYLSASDIRERLKIMAAKPNGLGSPHDKKNAEYLKSLFTKWGFDAHIETFKVLFPTPKERVLELVAPTHFEAALREPPIEGDATSDIYKNALPPYNAYAADGDVTAGLVYVNQGLPEDYQELAEHGISVEGKIVIVQYGGSWRGIKPRLAQEHGAVGCIIYSDPEDDGYRVGDTYPEGSWRPALGVQRGSVMNMTIHPGGPLTPGVGADEDAKRIPRNKSKVIKDIPILPISYKDAQPLLAALEGPVAPRSWQGALPITYHIGGSSSAMVHLKTIFNWDMVTLYDVIAKIKGSVYPDQWVIRGNHHDGWVFGAADPLSGNVAMMEEAKALGKLMDEGWKPKRTIIYCSWDGEEQGLLGSTEWVEEHADELKQKAVLYVNTDSNSRGFLGMGGSHSLQHYINQIARIVPDPETDVSVLERSRARRVVNGDKDAIGSHDLPIYALGSGSDYSPFFQHIGISSLNLGYGGEGGGGVYHSRYDSFDHYLRFGDPTFEYGVALAKTAGRAILRFANADILPYRFTDMAEQIQTYIKQVEDLLGSMREKWEYRQKLYDMNAFVLASDPTHEYHPPKEKSRVPHINFAPIKNAVDHLIRNAAAYDSTLSSQMQKGMALSSDELTAINKSLQSASQELTDPQGLPKRPWFRHTIYAPGYYTGYGVKTLPGVREAIEQREWDLAAKEIVTTAKAIKRYAGHIEETTALF